MTEKTYWHSPVGQRDDFDMPIDHEVGGIIIDGKTAYGPWALMTPSAFRAHGIGKLGLGLGQKYEKQADGKWLKVEG